MTQLVSENNNQKSAFAALFSVLILMIISGFVITSILVSSATGIQNNSVYRDGIEARALADSCANVAIDNLKDDNTYPGSESITIASKQCQILVISGSGNNNRVVRGQATVNGVTKKIEVNISELVPNTIINYWEERDY